MKICIYINFIFYAHCKLQYRSTVIFTFSYTCNGRKSIDFGTNFRNGDFYGFTRYEVTWIWKLHYLHLVSVCVYMWACYQHNTNYSNNIKSGIHQLYHIQILLETFYKDQPKILYTGAHKKILIHWGLWSEFLVSEFLRI